MVLDAIVRAADALLAGIDGRVRCGADFEFCKRVVFDFDGVAWGSFACSLDTFCLKKGEISESVLSLLQESAAGQDDDTYSLLEFGICALFDQRVGEAEGTARLLVAVCEVHGGKEGKGHVVGVHAGHGKVG